MMFMRIIGSGCLLIKEKSLIFINQICQITDGAMMNRKGDVNYWLVRLILALLILFVLIMIVSQAGSAGNGFLEFLRGLL